MNKDGGGDRIPVELFQILKDDAVKVLCAQHASKFGKLSSGHRPGKCQFSFQPQERQCQRVPKLPHNCTHLSSVQSLSHVRLFATPWIAACHTSLSITNSQSLLKLISIESVMPSNHLILCRPLLLLPPIAPSIRVFSNESTLPMRWPKN